MELDFLFAPTLLFAFWARAVGKNLRLTYRRTFHRVSQNFFQIVHQIKEARLCDLIIYTQTVFAIFQQAGSTEEHQLLRDIRLPLAQGNRQMANTFLTRAQ